MLRLFWVVIAVVFVGAAAAVFMRGGSGDIALPDAPMDAPRPGGDAVSLAPIESRPEPGLVVEQPEGAVGGLIETTVDEVVEPAEEVRVESIRAEENRAIDTLAIDSDVGASLDAMLGIALETDETAADEDGGAERADVEVAAARLVAGGAVLGERFEVRGAGTMGEPYVIGWDVLMSAQETYRPRQGKKDIPEWVRQIDGKYVRVDGFIVLPVMGGVMNEVLLARNEWDGCCIGVPPTAYDSIEVRLRTDGSQVGGRHAVNYGSIVGKISVDPYLWKDWLISMYVMEDAVIERQGL